MTALIRFLARWGHALAYDNIGNLGELRRRLAGDDDRARGSSAGSGTGRDR
jgi:hypothetical protein